MLPDRIITLWALAYVGAVPVVHLHQRRRHLLRKPSHLVHDSTGEVVAVPQGVDYSQPYITPLNAPSHADLPKAFDAVGLSEQVE